MEWNAWFRISFGWQIRNVIEDQNNNNNSMIYEKNRKKGKMEGQAKDMYVWVTGVNKGVIKWSQNLGN